MPLLIERAGQPAVFKYKRLFDDLLNLEDFENELLAEISVLFFDKSTIRKYLEAIQNPPFKDLANYFSSLLSSSYSELKVDRENIFLILRDSLPHNYKRIADLVHLDKKVNSSSLASIMKRWSGFSTLPFCDEAEVWALTNEFTDVTKFYRGDLPKNITLKEGIINSIKKQGVVKEPVFITTISHSFKHSYPSIEFDITIMDPLLGTGEIKANLDPGSGYISELESLKVPLFNRLFSVEKYPYKKNEEDIPLWQKIIVKGLSGEKNGKLEKNYKGIL